MPPTKLMSSLQKQLSVENRKVKTFYVIFKMMISPKDETKEECLATDKLCKNRQRPIKNFFDKIIQISLVYDLLHTRQVVTSEKINLIDTGTLKLWS